MIDLSVIVPVYNVEEYIEDCLKSIIAQTYSKFEVIIVDDGSSDKSIELAKNVIGRDKRFRILTKENGGLSDARNFGVKYVNGEFLTFLDSDDFIDNDLFEMAFDKIKKEKLDIIVYDFKRYHNDKRISIKKCLFNMEDKYSLTRVIPNAWNKIIRSSIWKDNNLKFPKGIWYEDIAIMPAILNYTGKIGYIENTYYYYRCRENSITIQNKYNEKMMNIIDALEYLEKNLSIDFDRNEYEYLCILHILYMGTQRLIEFDKKEKFNYILEYMNNKFPSWYENKRIKNLPFLKKLYLYFIHKKNYNVCKILVKIRQRTIGG